MTVAAAIYGVFSKTLDSAAVVALGTTGALSAMGTRHSDGVTSTGQKSYSK
jgi:hypothetical protein